MGLGFWRGPRAILLPIYGAVIGALGAGFFAIHVLPTPAAAIIAAILWGVLAFLPHQRRIGRQVWVIFVAAMLLRYLLISDIPNPHVLAIFMAAQTVRAAMIAIAWVSRPAGLGIAHEFSSTLTTPVALMAITIGVITALLCGLRPAAMILVGTYLIIRVVRWFAYRYAGGVNANLLGLTQLLTELFILLMFTCSACRWQIPIIFT